MTLEGLEVREEVTYKGGMDAVSGPMALSQRALHEQAVGSGVVAVVKDGRYVGCLLYTSDAADHLL